MAEDFSNLSAQDLVKKKDEIEQNIKELFQILDTVSEAGHTQPERSHLQLNYIYMY